jgi:hypothetical protein
LDTVDLTAGVVQQVLHDEFVCPLTRVPLDSALILAEDLAELGRYYAAVATLKDTLSSMDLEHGPVPAPSE